MRTVDDKAAETRVGEEEVVRERHGDVMASAGAVRVYAKPYDLEKWRGGLEEADPWKDGTGARGEVEFLYMEEMLRKDIDGVELLRRAGGRTARREGRRPGPRRRRPRQRGEPGREAPRVQQHARLARVGVS